MRSLNFVFLLVLCVSVFAVTGNASAETHLRKGASDAEIKKALLNTRGIRRGSATASVRSTKPQRNTASVRSEPSASHNQTARVSEPPKTSEGEIDAGPASFQIFFDLNSARLRTDAREVLDKLGNALNSPELSDYRFVVEGHTDASGPDNFNLELSEMRAKSVRDYLVNERKVDPARLESRGLGESDLFDPSEPAGAINRRVRFVNPDDA
jgi:outer membrane protein OmpA-like peptidoglycan-associated protein